jgi:hypothetical protein
MVRNMSKKLCLPGLILSLLFLSACSRTATPPATPAADAGASSSASDNANTNDAAAVAAADERKAPAEQAAGESASAATAAQNAAQAAADPTGIDDLPDDSGPFQAGGSGNQDETVNTSLMPRNADELKALRAKNDETIWANEVLAQKHERAFINLWDRMIHEKDKYAVLKQFSLQRFLVGTEPKTEPLDWQIERIQLAGATQEIPADRWSDWVGSFERDGYQIIESEFHHSAFEPAPDGANSQVSFLLHVTHAERDMRYILRGVLHVHWLAEPGADGNFQPDTVEARDLVILSRPGSPAFVTERMDRFPTDPSGKKLPTTIHPLIIHDLDHDGLPEIIVGGFNHVYRNKGNWKFEFGKLCQKPVPHVNAGALADFTGDGNVDYIAAIKNGFPFLYAGTADGQFPDAPRLLKFTNEPMRVPVNVVPGDIDGDGDLDVFLGQQKPGYFNGDIPTPYYDARDSFPCYLLQNDGKGNFTDITSAAGLGDKARRRNFSASFIDYDLDNDLDLILTSDFSGTDVFENDGKGNFTDISDKLQPQAYAFGMSHTFGDYNLDGGIDFLTVGMSSTTARRLEQMKLRREDFADYDKNRMNMGYGNRLYLFQDGKFVQAPFNQDVARTGWSWGSTTLDFDNDGDPDIYVVNGQTSGKTTQDYCTSFWCHDVYYKRGERPDNAIRELFDEMTPLFNGNGISWNGYEHNALLMNIGGNRFVNIGFLMDVGFEFDSRAAVSGDIDGDGHVDLVVEHKDLRSSESKLYIVRNQWQGDGHFIGVHLRQGVGNASPLGARVVATLEDGRKLVQHNVAGHSVWVQHANTIHFGLGKSDKVASLEVHWPDGTKQLLTAPAVDQYHAITSGQDTSDAATAARTQ